MDRDADTADPTAFIPRTLDIDDHVRRARRLRAAWIARQLRRLATWWRRRAAERELAGLDDRTLRDIGVARSDIPSIARGTRARDASRRERRPPAITEAAAPEAWCWLNGELLPASRARVSVLDHGLLYGDGVFEGIRFYGRCPFRLAEHLARLRRSAAATRLAVPYDDPALERAVAGVIAAFGVPDGYLRLVVTRGAGRLGLDPFSCARPNVFILADRLRMASEHVRRTGARAIIAATRRLGADGLDPRVKSLNYLNHILARMEAANAGADEAILLNREGRVAEGTADNVFVVRDGVLLTPPASDGALEGVTRATVLDLARRRLGIPTRIASLGPYDLYTADEVFLTGTGAELLPVREVDGRPVAVRPGGVFAQIAEAFRDLIRTETERARRGAPMFPKLP